MRIYRYQLPITDEVMLPMPRGAQVLSVGSPRGESQMADLWALVDTDFPVEPRRFHIIGTGNPMPARLGRFVGTFSALDGVFIGHVFEAKPEGIA